MSKTKIKFLIIDNFKKSNKFKQIKANTRQVVYSPGMDSEKLHISLGCMQINYKLEKCWWQNTYVMPKRPRNHHEIKKHVNRTTKTSKIYKEINILK